MNILIDGQTFETPEVHRGIGIYTKSVINNMLKLNYEHNWYLCVSDDKNLGELDAWVRKKLHVIKRPEVKPEINYVRNGEYTRALKEIVEEKQIDLVWIPNMLMVNVLGLEEMLPCRVCVTVYDIIPHLFPIKEWGEPIVAEYNRRLEFLAKQDVELLFISQATKDDFEKSVGKAIKSVVTFLAADARRFYRKRLTEDKASHIVLFTGGFDYRKNIDGAIAAFGQAMEDHDDDEEFAKCKLVIVGATNEATRQKYEEILAGKQLLDKVVLTGYISEEELGDYYKKADVFFFPSMYEGFGLPILEAMLGGDYVVSADNSSLPEVCGGHALLCGTEDLQKMADALYQGFCNAMSESVEEKNARQEYALNFTWEKTAQTTLEFWEGEEICLTQGEKSKIAMLTPWPEQESGISYYEYKLVPYLQKYYQIDIYADFEDERYKNYEDVSFYPLSTFEGKGDRYKHVLCQIGNNVEFHKDIYEKLESYGGIAEVHDYVLTPFFFHSYFLQDEKEKFGQLLEKGYGEAGKAEYEACSANLYQPDMNDFPMTHVVARCADKVIFHNHWSAEQIGRKNTTVIPLACFESAGFDAEVMERKSAEIKEKYKITDEIIIGCFGWVNANKRPLVMVRAVQELLQAGYAVKLMFWGKAVDDEVETLTKELGIEESVFVSGYLDEETYEAALEMTDIVINLRYPSMGESSATLCEAFKYGKAVIVSDLNQYTEFPDEVCWKVPICEQEQELLKQYLMCLIDKKEVRMALGENARNYADHVLKPENIAAQYYKFLEKKE